MEYDLKVLDSLFESETIQPPEHSLNNMYLFNCEGKLEKSYENQICFANLTYGEHGEADIFAATHKCYIRYGESALTPEGNFAFTDFLINRSQFADAFLQKDADWCVKRQGVVIRGDLPSNYVIFLATLHRTTQEYTKVPLAWLHLRNYVNEDVALYMAHFFIVKEGSLEYAPIRSNHAAMCNSYSNRTQLENFLAANLAYPNGKIFNKDTYFRGIDTLWQNKVTNGWLAPIIEKLPGKANPFIRPFVEKGKKNIIQDWIDRNDIGDLIKCAS